MIYKEAGTVVVDNFTNDYFSLHDHVLNSGDVVKSRNGDTREVLNFKTQLTNPTHRCIAGHKRNMNIFFLMAESMWIFKGRRDVEFLDIFNSKMKNYSDGGKFFWAPYGWRMRYHGIYADTEAESSNLPYFDSGIDQFKKTLQMLSENPADRRVVVSIWNPEMDLGADKKDLPCNDMLMFKIRDGVLHQTIQNRSNDLNWGLTTNVYQFSFIGEIMADLLDIRYGTQTHNSQSLHLYVDQNTTIEMEQNYAHGNFDLYSVVKVLPIFCNFREKDLPISKKLGWVDFYFHGIILKLMNLNNARVANDEEQEIIFDQELKQFCYHFWCIYKILCIYVNYKKHKDHAQAIGDLLRFNIDTGVAVYDFFLLAINFFMARLKEKSIDSFNAQNEIIKALIPNYKNIPLGDL